MSLDFYLEETKKTIPTGCPCQIVEVYEANITHNLTQMASEAGLYEILWRPTENGFKYARSIINDLEAGLDRLKANPEHFKQFNPKNGWGNYELLVEFTENVLAACREKPGAVLRTCT